MHYFRQFLSLFLSLILTVQPFVALAQQAPIVAAPNAPNAVRPYVDQTWNGTPKINITTPNAAGVSRNVYDRFNVDSRGLILNNGATNSLTQTSGWVEGNPNLRPGGEAKLILNEVSGTSMTTLNGPIEVAGRRADVIIANENGITCFGCGFINTSRATLTTGRPTFGADGRVSDINVERGVITIGGSGLEARSTDQLDILARAVQVYGDIKANRLEVIAGSNKIKYDTLDATAIAGSGQVPTLAVDVSAMGGMYANRIRLIATERGVGVNMDGKMASASTLSLSSNGRLSIGGQIKAPVVQLYARERTRITGAVQAQTHMSVRTEEALVLEGTLLTTNGGLDITSTGDTTLKGQTAAQTITLTVGGKTTIQATSQAAGDYRITTAQLVNESQILAQNVIINASDSVSNAVTGGIQAQTVTITAPTISNDGQIIGLNTLALTANSLTNAGTLASYNSTAITTSVFENTVSGHVVANILALNVADTTTNAGLIEGYTTTTLLTHTLTNSGTINGNLGGLTVTGTGGSLTNSGVIAGNGIVVSNFALVSNTGSVTTQIAVNTAPTTGAITINSDTIENLGGRFITGGHITLNAVNSLRNSGTVVADGDISLFAGTRIDNSAGVISGNTVLLTARDEDIISTNSLTQAKQTITFNAARHIDLTGSTLVGDGNVTLTGTTGAMSTNNAILFSKGQINLTAATLSNNHGSISALRDIMLAATSLDNTSGRIISDTSLALNISQTVTNTNGILYGKNNLTLTPLAMFDNTGGKFISDSDININAQTIINAGGELSTGKTLTLTAQSLDNTSGKIIATGTSGATLITLSGLINNQSGLIESANTTVALSGQSINSNNGKIIAQNTNAAMSVTATGVITLDNGVLASQGALNITADSLNVTQAGTAITGRNIVQANTDLTINVREANFGTAAKIIANDDLLFNATGTVTNAGVIYGTLNNHISADRLNNSGSIGSNKDVTITAPTVNNSGKISGANVALQGDANLIKTGSNLQNSGVIYANTITLNQFDKITNSGNGLILSEGAMLIVTNSFSNDKDVVSKGDLNINASSFNNIQRIEAANSLTLTTANLVNSGHILARVVDSQNTGLLTNSGDIKATHLLLITSQSVENTGLLRSEYGLSIRGLSSNIANAGSLTNSGVIAGIDIRLADFNLIDNQQGLITSRLNGNQTVTTGRLTVFNTPEINNSHGTMMVDGAINLSANGDIKNRFGAILGDSVALTAGVGGLDGTGGYIRSNQSINIEAQGNILLTSSALDAGNRLVLKSLNGGINTDFAEIYVKNQASIAALGTISNREGRIAAGGDLNILSLNAIDNSLGTLMSQSHLNLQSQNLTNTAGMIYANSDLSIAVHGHINNASGTLLSNQASSVTGLMGIDNSHGVILGSTTLDVNSNGVINNNYGTIHANQRLRLEARDLTNAHGLVTTGLSSAESYLKITGTLDNNNGKIESQSAKMTLQASSLLNQFGVLQQLNQSDSSLFVLNVSGLIDNNNGRIYGAGDTLILADKIDLGMNSKVESLKSIQLSVRELVTGDTTTVNAQNNLSIALTSGFTQRGLLKAGKQLHLSALSHEIFGNILAEDAMLSANGTVNIRASGNIETQNSLQIQSQSLTNYGRLASLGSILINVDQAIANYNLILSNGDLVLGANRIENTDALIWAKNNIYIGGKDIHVNDNARATAVVNTRARIEANTGDLLIQAAVIENIGLAPTFNISGNHTAGSNINPVTGFIFLYTIAEDTFNNDGRASNLIAGNNIQLKADTVSNINSNISAGRNVSITADTFINRGLGATKTTSVIQKGTCFNCHVSFETTTTFGGKVEAGGQVYLNLTNYVNELVPTSAMTTSPLGVSQGSRVVTASNQPISMSVSSGVAQIIAANTPTPTVINLGNSPTSNIGAQNTTKTTQTNSLAPVSSVNNPVVSSQVTAPSSQTPVVQLSPLRQANFALSSAIQLVGAPIVLTPQPSAFSLLNIYSSEPLPPAKTNNNFIGLASFMSSDYMQTRIGNTVGLSSPQITAENWYKQSLNSQSIYVTHTTSGQPQQAEVSTAASKIKFGDTDINLVVAPKNQTAMISGSDIVIHSKNSIKGLGFIDAKTLLSVQSDHNIDISGFSDEAKTMKFMAGGDINGMAARLTASSDLILVADGSVKLTAAETIYNGSRNNIQGGANNLALTQFKAGDDLTIISNKGSVDLSAVMLSASDNVSIKAKDGVNFTSKLSGSWNAHYQTRNVEEEVFYNSCDEWSCGSFSLTQISSITELVTQDNRKSVGVQIASGGNLMIDAGSFSSHGSTLSSDKLLQVRSTGVFDNSNSLLKGDDVTLSAKSFKGTGSHYSANDDLTLISKDNLSLNDFNFSAHDLNVKSDGSVSLVGEKGTLGIGYDVQKQYYSGFMGFLRGMRDVYVPKTIINLPIKPSLTLEGDLTIQAGNDVVMVGANVDVGGNTRIDATHDVTLSAHFITAGYGGNYDQKSQSTTIDSGGTTIITSGNNIAIQASDITSGGNVQLLTSHNLSIEAAKEIKTRESSSSGCGFMGFNCWRSYSYSESVTNDVSHITSTTGSVTLKADDRISLVGVDIKSHLAANIVAGDDLLISSVKNTNISVNNSSSSSWWGLSGSSSSYSSSSLTNASSFVKAGTDLTTASGGSTRILASQLSGGSSVTIKAGVGSKARKDASVNILSATDMSEVIEKSEDWGFFGSSHGMFWLWSQEETSETTKTAKNVASVISSGGTINISAAQDAIVTGSTVTSLGNTTINAGRDITVTGGIETKFHEKTNEISGWGTQFTSTNSSVSVFNGYASFKDELLEKGSFTASSIINSGGDLTLSASHNINQTASVFNATHDMTITAGNDFTSLAAFDTSSMHQFHEELKIGMTTTLSSGALAVADTLNRAANNAAASRGAYKGAGTAAAILNGAGAISNFAKSFDPTNPLGLSLSVSFGVNHSSSTQDSSNTNAAVSTITAGHDLVIVTGGTVTLQGTQVAADNRATILAENLIMEAALNSFKNSSASDSFSASVGWSSSGGFNAAMSMSDSDKNSHGTSMTNALLATGALTLITRDNVTINGGNISALTANMMVGGNLTLSSQQNTSMITGSSSNFGFSISQTGGSLSMGASNTNGTSSWTVPSSIETIGSLSVNVGKATTVTGAMMNSSLGALNLTTNTLVVADLRDVDQLNTTGGGFSAGYSTDSKGKTSPTGSVNINLENKDKQGVTHGTIGAGNITVRSLSATEQAALLADINRDPTKFTQVIVDNWDALRAEVDFTNIAALPDTLKNFGEALKRIDSFLAEKFPEFTEKQKRNFEKALIAGVDENMIREQCMSRGYNIFNPINWLITPAFADDANCTVRVGKTDKVFTIERGQAADCAAALAKFKETYQGGKNEEQASPAIIIYGVVLTAQEVYTLTLVTVASINAAMNSNKIKDFIPDGGKQNIGQNGPPEDPEKPDPTVQAGVIILGYYYMNYCRLVGCPALKNDPYNPDVVNDRNQRPTYETNPAHNLGANPNKTQEPSDAAQVFDNSIRLQGDVRSAPTWLGVGSNGQIYRFFSDQTTGKAHFSGYMSPSDFKATDLKIIQNGRIK
jgi:filamentous hemagglutinin